MTRFLVLAAIIALAVVQSDACTSSSGRTPAWDVGRNGEIYPVYNNGNIGIGYTHRFRRDTDGKREMFNLIDANGDKYILACEWITEGGGTKNFVEFLNDDDTDGDERISWEEFQKVTVITHADTEARISNKQ